MKAEYRLGNYLPAAEMLFAEGLSPPQSALRFQRQMSDFKIWSKFRSVNYFSFSVWRKIRADCYFRKVGVTKDRDMQIAILSWISLTAIWSSEAEADQQRKESAALLHVFMDFRGGWSLGKV